MVYVFSVIAGLVAALHLVGGFGALDVRSYDDVLGQPVSEWSVHECRSVIASNVSNNIWDAESPVRVYATRFGPHTFAAVNREDQVRNGWSVSRFRESFAWDIERYLGLHADSAAGGFRNRRGRLMHDERDLDSLLFLVSFDLKVDPINVGNPALSGVMDLKLFNPEHADLEDLQESIFLENEQGYWLKPTWIAPTGTRTIGRQEVYVSFLLRTAAYDFLERSRSMAVVVRGFGSDIRLPFTIHDIAYTN